VLIILLSAYLTIALFLFIFLQLPKCSGEDSWPRKVVSSEEYKKANPIYKDLLFAFSWPIVSILAPLRNTPLRKFL
jgi:hypothetical protein